MDKDQLVELLDCEFAKLPNYRGPDVPCEDLVEQGYGNALINIRAALSGGGGLRLEADAR